MLKIISLQIKKINIRKPYLTLIGSIRVHLDSFEKKKYFYLNYFDKNDLKNNLKFILISFHTLNFFK